MGLPPAERQRPSAPLHGRLNPANREAEVAAAGDDGAEQSAEPASGAKASKPSTPGTGSSTLDVPGAVPVIHPPKQNQRSQSGYQWAAPGGPAPQVAVNISQAADESRPLSCIQTNTLGDFRASRVASKASRRQRTNGVTMVSDSSAGIAFENDLHEVEVPQVTDGMHNGWTAKLARSPYFENTTLSIISLNAVWIGVDMEHNNASVWTNAALTFQIADNFFCTYFSLEIIVRFFAFERKGDFWRSKMFLFDLSLVALMVFETWVLIFITESDGGGAGSFMANLSVLRLLRLLRLTRMVRLMRMIPELMTLMKGLVAALKNVSTNVLFQVGLWWIFGIIFTSIYRDPEAKSTEAYLTLHNDFFKDMGVSMVTLFVQGTIMDELSTVATLLRADNYIMLLLWFFFVLISSLTLLNMLIGVVTSVMAQIADEEESNIAIATATQTLEEVFAMVDSDGSNSISLDEFNAKLEDPDSPMLQALLDIGIPEHRLYELGATIFEEKKGAGSEANDLSFELFREKLLMLRPGTAVSIRDIQGLRRASQLLLTYAYTSAGAIDDVNIEMESIAAVEERQRPPPTPPLQSVPTQVILEEIRKRLGSDPVPAA
jgi:voltage-gated sodium channel